MKKIIALLFVITMTACQSQDCKDLPNQFNNYRHALNEVKSANFTIEDTVNTSRSSIIENAEYFSCNSKIGYLIIKIRNTEYIYQNVPISVWGKFKKTDSFGRFYNRYIKGNYPLKLL